MEAELLLCSGAKRYSLDYVAEPKRRGSKPRTRGEPQNLPQHVRDLAEEFRRRGWEVTVRSKKLVARYKLGESQKAVAYMEAEATF